MPVSKDYYYKLGSEIQEERIEAATTLLSALVKENNKEDWDYALNRLIKGITTSRQSARFGFSMALTELVRELISREDYDLSISTYLEKLLDATKAASSMKGKELRSTLFGRLFGLQALVNCSMLLDPKYSSKDTLLHFVRLIVELSSAKSWLRETAMFTLCQFFESYLQSEFSDDSTTVAFLQFISDEGLVFTTEGLAFFLTVPQSSRSYLCSQITANSNWKHGDPMSKGNLPTLAKVLKDVDVVDAADGDEKPEAQKGKSSKQKGSWSPRIPFVWDLLLKHFVGDSEVADDAEESTDGKKRKKSSSQSSKKKMKLESAVEPIHLKEFWRVVIDDTLFADTSSPERKFWGFEIFMKFFQPLPNNKVEFLFTPNMIRCLINQSAKSDRLLNKLSTKALNTIIETCKQDLSKVIPSLNSLIDENKGGVWNFDHLSRSKTSDSLIGILGQLDNPEEVPASTVEQNVSHISDFLLAKFEAGLQSQREVPQTMDDAPAKYSNDNVLRWILDKLLVLFRSTKRYDVPLTKQIEDVFKFLIQHAYFKSKTGPNVSHTLVKVSQERLNSLLSEFIGKRRREHSWSLYCIKQVEKVDAKEDYALILDLSDDLKSIKDEALEILDRIKSSMKKNKSTRNQQFCFELLFSMVLLQLYEGETETFGVLEDLKGTYLAVFDNADEELDASVTLTEILLSFVSKKSSLLKKMAGIVWESYMCVENKDGSLNLNEQCFELLFNVLKSRENEEGQKSLFEGEEEFAEVEDESDSDESDESDSEDESPKTDGKKTTDEIEEETTKKLANALGIPAEYDGEVKFEDLDSDGDDGYESESMDDEQMMAIDEELSKIFKERRNALTANSTSKKNNENAMAKEQMLLFKNRVLDLLDSFAKVQPNSVHNVSFIKPIVHLINTTSDKNLGVKAHKILKTRVSKLKITPADVSKVYTTEEEVSAYVESLLDLIRWLQEQAAQFSSNQSHSAACGQGCIIVSKCLITIDSDNLPKIISVYSEALTKWACEPKNRIHASMFFDFINWLNAKRSGSQSQ